MWLDASTVAYLALTVEESCAVKDMEGRSKAWRDVEGYEKNTVEEWGRVMGLQETWSEACRSAKNRSS